MDVIEKLRQSILDQIRANVPVQTVWAECRSANISDGTMVAVRAGIEYYDVLLGLGGDLLEPEPGSRVLLGLVENKAAAAFLIYAERTARRWINGDAKGGLVIADQVATRLNALEQDINTLKTAMAAWAPVSQDGGAALKAATATWFGSQLQTTSSQQLQNTRVSHG